ncbi:MAG TPA: cytochrome P450 [Solirubrobacteraceae bacterium]|nr:cytochrome P450 [Solirubrobacteraceae bacterium]
MGASAPDLTSVDLLDHDRFADHEPWELFDLLQREAPVHFHPEPGGRGFWVLTKYDDVQAVIRDAKTFSSEVGGSATIEDLPEDVLKVRRNLLEFDPPKHGRYRRLMSTRFTPGAVAQYEEWLRGLVRNLLDRIESGAEFDLVGELAAPIPIRVLAHLMGLPEEDLPRLIELGDRLLVDTEPDYVGEHAFGSERDEDRYKPFGSPWAEELCTIGRAYYEDRRRCPREDLLTLIANAEVDGQPLSAHDLDNMFALMIVAGNETTRQAIALGTLALAHNPDQYELVRAQPELIPSASEEMLRFASPVWWFRRTATKDVEIRGQHIAAGDKVVVWFAAANRDPDHYPDPHRFDVTRNPTDQLTFGRGGPHHCLGVHLARLEVRVYLEELVGRVSGIELAGPPLRHRSNFTNGLKRLPVRMTLAA